MATFNLPRKSTLAEPEPERGKHHYRKMREPFAAELKDPATRRLLRGIVSAENPGAQSAVVESLMNRTAMVNEQRAAKGQPPLTLKAMISGHADIGGGKSFYGPMRTGAINQHLARLDSDKNYSAQLDSYIDRALGGADTIRGHTDQGSRGDPNYDAGGVGVNINGERFNDWGYGGSRAWREKQQSLAATPEPLDPTPNVGSGQTDYDNAASVEAAKGMVDPTPNVGSGADDYAAPSLVESVKNIEKKTDYNQIASGAFEALAGITKAGTSKTSPTGPGVIPMSLQAPPGITPTVDPRHAEMQRQQLALAMQRLNSGKLF